MIKHLARKHGTTLARLTPSATVKRHSRMVRGNRKILAGKRKVPVSTITSVPEQLSNISEEKEKNPSIQNDGQSSSQSFVSELSIVKQETPDENITFVINESSDESVTAAVNSTNFVPSTTLITEITQASSAIATYNPMLHLQATLKEGLPASSKKEIKRFFSNQVYRKKHSCEICGYVGYASDVTRHKRTHTGERPYQCPVCNSRFSLRGNMTKHVARMHPTYSLT